MARLLKIFENNSVAFLSFVFVYLTVLSLFLTDSFYILGNLHDLWIPQISAEAVKQGLVQHLNFNTSFGFFYAYLNYFSLVIIEYFPDFFSRSDLIVLSSVQFSLILIVLFLIVKLSSFNNKVFWVFLPLILSINFQLRNMSKPFHYADVLWYGSYNAHLWSLLLIQLISILDFYFYKVKEEFIEEINKYKFLVFIFIQFLCTYIAINYKLNFFIASVGLASSVFFFMSNKLKVLYVSSLLFLGVLSLYLTEVLTSYSYFEYFKDITQAIESKRTTGVSYILNLVLFFIMFAPLVFLNNKKYKHLHGLKKTSPEFLKKMIDIKKIFLPDLYFCISLGFSLLLGLVGDWQRPATYFLIVIFVFSIQAFNSKRIKLISWFCLSGIFILNCFSNLYTSSPKLLKLTEKQDKYKSPLYKKVNLIEDKNSFTVHDYQGSFEIFEFLRVNTSDPDTILNISSTYRSSGKNWGLLFRNVEYARLVSDAVNAVKDFGYDSTDNIFMLEFVNPLPILLNSRIPENTFHWIHLGTTFSINNFYKLGGFFKELDIIYVPTITTDKFSQTFINCSFYNWNENHKLFKPVHVGVSGILFVSNLKAEQSLRSPLSYDKSILMKNCKESMDLAHKLWE